MRNAYTHVSVASDDTRPQVYKGVCSVLMVISTVGTWGDSCEFILHHIA